MFRAREIDSDGSLSGLFPACEGPRREDGMSVAEIGQLHNRYVRLSDQFKSVWTFNQLANGIFKNLLLRPIPIEFDFQTLYEKIRSAGEKIQTISRSDALPMMEQCEEELSEATQLLVSADLQIPPSILRRFFEKLRSQDEKLLFHIIKFYLYAGATSGEQRDKLDFLLTRAGESWNEEREEYVVSDKSELRRTLGSLLHGMAFRRTDPSVAADLTSEFNQLREAISRVQRFDDLASGQWLSRSRDLKQQIGDAYFDVDVLIAIIECNLETKNRFSKLYRFEEERLVSDAQRLVENEQSIAHGFGDSNPELLEEIRRFKRFKAEFDQSRADSNIKHNVISSLKSSISRILEKLEGDFDPGSSIDSLTPFDEVEQETDVRSRFGDDELLSPYLSRIVSVLESIDADSSFNRIASAPGAEALRLEPWELSAFAKLFWHRPLNAGESDDLLYLYLRAAALRIRIDEEARELADSKAQPGSTILQRVRNTLDRAREFDEAFKLYLQEQMQANSANTHHIYRSRLRLLRAYSGLWLLYDQHQEHGV